MASQGDPRVHFVMNLILSSVFAAVVLWGLDFIGTVDFTLANLAVATLALMILTYVMTN